MDQLIIDLQTYRAEPRSASFEREFAAAKIRPLTAPERLEFLNEAMALDLPVGLNLAFLSLKQSTYRSRILFPGIIQADPATSREYLVYGMCSGDVLRCLRALRPIMANDPGRMAYILYYLAAFISPMGTACQETVRCCLDNLAANGHLNFDRETWDGGPNDLDWFVWLDGDRHWIWWPPVRTAIDRRIGRTITWHETFDYYRWNGWREAHVRTGSRYTGRLALS